MCASVGLYENITLDSSFSQLVATGVEGQSSIYLSQCGGNKTLSALTNINIFSDARIKLSINYEIV